MITDNGSGFTFTNVNNKIVGAGVLGAEFTLFVVNQAGGVIDGNGSGTVATGNTRDGNKRRIDRGDDLGGVAMAGGRVYKLRDDRGAGHRRIGKFLDVTVANSTTKALILASGSGAQVNSKSDDRGGTLKTSARRSDYGLQ